MWMRATLTRHDITSGDGRGPRFGYTHGETEDYLLNYVSGSLYGP